MKISTILTAVSLVVLPSFAHSANENMPMNMGMMASSQKCWADWGPKCSKITPEDVATFRNHLPDKGRKNFDRASPQTQKISVVILRGLQASCDMPIGDEDYHLAFKMANKIEAGFYFNKAVHCMMYDR